MITEQVRNGLIHALMTVQTSSGRPMTAVTDRTCPVGDLAGFDSVNCVEVCALLSEQFGRDIELKVLVTNLYGPAATVGEMVVRLTNYLNEGSSDER